MQAFIRFIILFISFSLISACGGGGGGSEPPPPPQKKYTYQPPANLNDGWTISHLEDLQIDVARMEAFMDGVKDGTYSGIDAVAIARNGQLGFYELTRSTFDQFDPFVNNTNLSVHILHSSTKSFISALVGIAHEEGFLPDLDASMIDYFDYGPYENWDDRKRDITIRNTLTMQLGLQWDEWSSPYGSSENSLSKLYANAPFYTRALFNLPMAADPGTTYVYNTGASMALGELVERAVGMRLEDYAELKLFEPMQITEAKWEVLLNSIPNTGGGLFLNARSMVKFGQLYLDDGVWNGQQILTPEWVADSLARAVLLNWDNTSGYGYQWWLGEFISQGRQYEFYSTRGYGGQFIFVVPELELVVAFQARNYGNDTLYALPFQLMEDHILPAIN